MMVKTIKILIIKLLIEYCFSYYIPQGYHTNSTSSNFSFGSCFGGFLAERWDAFKHVSKMNPSLFVWTGDVTYVDLPKVSLINHFISTDDFDIDRAYLMYNNTYYDEYYKDFRKKYPIIGVWDDHDFGVNNGNGKFKSKEDSKEIFLNFLEEPRDSIRRIANKSIDSSYSFGSGYKSYKIILLDVRFNKDPGYIWEQEMISSEQWLWLENELLSNETFTFIVSGTQYLPVNRFITECWYTKSRERLFNLIGKLKKSGVILLSGDVHFGQIMKTICVHPAIGYHLYEISSSGLTHYAGIAQPLFDYILANDYSLAQIVPDYNFGFTEFNWGESKEDSSTTISIHDLDNVIRLQITLNYSDLIHSSSFKDDVACEEKLLRRFKTPMEYFQYYVNEPKYIISLLILYYMIYSILKIVYYTIKFVYNSIVVSIKFIIKIFNCKKKKEDTKNE